MRAVLIEETLDSLLGWDGYRAADDVDHPGFLTTVMTAQEAVKTAGEIFAKAVKTRLRAGEIVLPYRSSSWSTTPPSTSTHLHTPALPFSCLSCGKEANANGFCSDCSHHAIANRRR